MQLSLSAGRSSQPRQTWIGRRIIPAGWLLARGNREAVGAVQTALGEALSRLYPRLGQPHLADPKYLDAPMKEAAWAEIESKLSAFNGTVDMRANGP